MNTSDSMTSISSAVSVITDDEEDDLVTPCLTRLPPSPPRKSSEKHHSRRGHLANMHLASSSATPAIAPRMSMEEYYTRPKSILVPPVPILLQPPPYDLSIADVKPISPRRIQPREEEGREKLPSYTCPINIRAVFLKKLELENAVQRARDRKWYRVMVELRGTALSIWGVRRSWLGEDETEDTGDHIGQEKTTETKRNPDLPRGVKRGELLRRYSLQHAEVGIAQDYLKRRYVIRLRLETEQLLLSCTTLSTHILWLESLTSAIAIAPSLEDRVLPEDTSLPRLMRGRRRRTATTGQPGQLGLEQINASIARQRNVIAEAQAAERSGTRRRVGISSMARSMDALRERTPMPRLQPSTPQLPPLSATSSMSSTSLSTFASIDSSSSPPSRNEPASPATPSPNRPNHSHSHSQSANHGKIQNNTANPSITASGKWRPHHTWIPANDLSYANRCFPVLLAKNPRRTNFVIMKGKRYCIDWTTGKLERWTPEDPVELVPSPATAKVSAVAIPPTPAVSPLGPSPAYEEAVAIRIKQLPRTDEVEVETDADMPPPPPPKEESQQPQSPRDPASSPREPSSKGKGKGKSAIPLPASKIPNHQTQSPILRIIRRTEGEWLESEGTWVGVRAGEVESPGRGQRGYWGSGEWIWYVLRMLIE